MKVSVLIVNWNSKEYVRRCLETIQATCGDHPLQIVVVDGGSFDGCGEMLAQEFPEVEFVQVPENVGFGRSNNLGFERVTGETLLLLNPDCELQPGSVQSLLAKLEKLPAAGLVGPRILNTDGTLQTSCVRAFPTPLNQALGSDWLHRRFPSARLWGNWEAFQSPVPSEVDVLSGACMLLRSQTFRKVGGFSAEFFMYGEDIDLCYKVRHLGLRNYYDPGAQVIHHGGQSSNQQFKSFSIVLMRESDQVVMRKWQGVWAATMYRVLMALSAVLRLGVLVPALLIARPEMRLQRGHAVMKWRAILRWALGLEPWSRQYTNPEVFTQAVTR